MQDAKVRDKAKKETKMEFSSDNLSLEKATGAMSR
jgi:hypothetical protein